MTWGLTPAVPERKSGLPLSRGEKSRSSPLCWTRGGRGSEDGQAKRGSGEGLVGAPVWAAGRREVDGEESSVGTRPPHQGCIWASFVGFLLATWDVSEACFPRMADKKLLL